MAVDLYLKNGQIVTETAVINGGVAVQNGKIVEIVTDYTALDAREVIDLEGKFLVPGCVDGHAHFNQPGREHWEDYRTGSMAAAAGGVTTAVEMPLNAIPPSTTRLHLARKRQLVASEAVVDYANWGGLVDNNLADLQDLNEDGVVGYKAFLSDSATDYKRIDDDILYEGLIQSRKLGNVVGVHAENEYVTKYLTQKMKTAGRVDRASWSESRPPATELEAIQRACFWAKVTGGNLHIVHVSLAEGVRAIAQARQEGVHASVETCPHYLLFDVQDFERAGPTLKCAPPIRCRENVEALWQCVMGGLVDTIGSDHSPCTLEEKEAGMDNIWKAWGGISGIQTMLPAMLTEGVHKRGLGIPALMKMLATNPARLFGLYPQKGAIRPEADADLVVVDIDREWTLSANQLFYKNKHSAFVDYSFKGAIERTLVRGVTVYQDGQIKAQPGFGKLYLRSQTYNY